jgi:hypothetical protein
MRFYLIYVLIMLNQWWARSLNWRSVRSIRLSDWLEKRLEETK